MRFFDLISSQSSMELKKRREKKTNFGMLDMNYKVKTISCDILLYTNHNKKKNYYNY